MAKVTEAARGREGDASEALLRALDAIEAGDCQEARRLCEPLVRRDGNDADALYVLGLADARLGAGDDAIKRLQRAANLKPDNPAIHHLLANAYQDQGKLDRAIASYRRAIRLKPDSGEFHNDLGTAFYAKGWLDDAAASYRRAVRNDPRHTVAVGNLAGVLRKKGDLRGARSYLKRELRMRIGNGMRRFIEPLTARRRTLHELGRKAGALAEKGHLSLAAVAATRALREDAADPWAAYVLALARKQQGDLREALVLARQCAAEHRLADHELLLRVGQLLAQLGHPEEGIDALRRAYRANRSDARVCYSLGILLLDKGDAEEARACLERALRLNAEAVGTRVALARMETTAGRLDAAERLIDDALRREPEDADALFWLAQVWRARDEFEKAQALYRRIAGMQIERVADWYRLAIAMREVGLYEEALECFEKALEIEPDSPVALSNRGLILTDLARPLEAIEDLRKALAINPGFADALVNLGRALHMAERHGEALECYAKAADLRPGWAIPMTLKGVTLEAQGLFAEAVPCYEQAFKLAAEDPAVRVNLAHMALISGDWDRGWELYESRQDIDEYRSVHTRLTLARWDGAPLEGKTIVVYGEQGIGDEINFASCLPDLLRLRPKRVLLTCGTKLGGLFRRSFPDVEVFAGEPREHTAWLRGLDPRPDYQVAAGSLHRFFRHSLGDFPRHEGYLTTDPERVRRWGGRLDALGREPKIGLSWKGGIIRTGELRRTLRLEQLLPILQTPGAQFVSLQYTDCEKDIADLRARHGVRVHHWQEAIDDYEDTAALVSRLDLVISVCTAVVHLAGAVNTPCWVMAPIGPHWRYAMPGDRMPWYPGVQVYRQARFGDWDEVLSRVCAALPGALEQRRSAMSS